MVTVILKISLDLPPVNSLKEKRRIIKPLITKIRNKFNVSISEVGNNDILRSAILGAAVVSNDIAFSNSVASKLINLIEQSPEVSLRDYEMESY